VVLRDRELALKRRDQHMREADQQLTIAAHYRDEERKAADFNADQERKNREFEAAQSLAAATALSESEHRKGLETQRQRAARGPLQFAVERDADGKAVRYVVQ
jgi:hypothetical protein